MARGIKISEEDRQTLVDLVREEIEMHQRGEIDRLSKNAELCKLVGVSISVVTRFLRDLPEELRKYRKEELNVQNGIETNLKNSKEDKEAFVDLVREEIEAHQKGQIKTLTENSELAELLGVCDLSIPSYLTRLNSELRSYKMKKLMEQFAKRNYQNGKGVASLTTEQRREIGKRNGKINLDLLRKKAYFVGGRFYALSQQEGAVALLLEKYIPGYDIKEGETFQIRGDSGKEIDFLVNGEFLEWHPIVLSRSVRKGRGDIESEEEYKSYRKIVGCLEGKEKQDFQKSYREILALSYRNSRQEAVDNSEYQGINVALATDVRELYDFISKCGENLPDFREFNREFNRAVKYVKSCAVKKGKKAEEAAV